MKKYILFLLVIFHSSLSLAWTNGPAGNATTDTLSECSDPPYSTHDWIADHALDLLPVNEKAWLLPHKNMYLLGTEAPDNDNIPTGCNAPNTGYDDRRKGHSVEWAADWSDFIVIDGVKKDRAAVRAQEEYEKAEMAFKNGRFSDAAFYLGAMAHYVGDVSQYGHSVPFEKYHSPYENWVKTRTGSFNAGVFETYIKLDRLVRRTPYTAVKRISKKTAGGWGVILHAKAMDDMFPNKKDNQVYLDSIGASLNLGVNELSDVLHTFYLNVVKQ